MSHPAPEDLARVPLFRALGVGRRLASVVASEPGTMWCLFGTTFRVVEAEHPEVAAAMAAAAEGRLLAV